jgi:hypothetical protein
MFTPENFTMEMGRDLMRRAEISVEDMVALLPITKQTFYNWVRGNRVRDKLRFKLAVARFQVLERALDKGLLPLPGHVTKSQRLPLLRDAFAKANK